MLDRAAALMPAMAVGADWSILHVTPCACDLLQRPESELVGRSVAEVLGLDDEIVVADLSDTFELRCDAPLGGVAARLPLRLRGALLDQPRQGAHAVLYLIDLSGELHAAAQIRALSSQLHHVWRLNSLGEMAAILAHELNQPLTAASAYLHSLKTDLDKVGLMGQSAARTADQAKGQVLRAGEIIRRMRNLLSTEAGTLAPERVSLIMDDLAPVLHILARDAGVSLDLQFDRSVDEVWADRSQLQQVITNLVRNGIEAAGLRPSPQVRVVGQSDGDAYRIGVEDNGPGIPGNDLDALQPSISTKPEGMGLGLSITRKILERHESRLCSGTSPLGGADLYFSLRATGRRDDG